MPLVVRLAAVVAVVCTTIVLLTLLVALGQFDRPKGEGTWLFHYQTLVAGVLATVAGALAIHFTRKQMRMTQRQFIKQLKVTTDLMRRELERETRVYQAQLLLLQWTLENYLKTGREGNLDYADYYVRRLIEMEESGPFPVLRKHMSFEQILSASTLRSLLDGFQTARGIGDDETREREVHNLASSLLDRTMEFYLVLDEVRGYADALIREEA